MPISNGMYSRIKREFKWRTQRVRFFIYERCIPFEVALRRKTGYISTQWLCSFYGSYRAGHYFENTPPGVPMLRWKGFENWHEVPARVMPIFAPFNTYRCTLRGEYFMRGTSRERNEYPHRKP